MNTAGETSAADRDADWPQPYVREELDARSLHFSMSQTQSRMRLREPDLLELEYTRTMMGFLMWCPQPRRLAMIGLGGGSLAKFCHRHLPRCEMVTVEVNPHVVALRRVFEVPDDGPRFRIVCDDGARFVAQTDERFDVVLVDGFDAAGMPARLGSRRFYDDCLDVLVPGGMLVVNLHAGDALVDVYVERIRASAGGEVLRVDDGDAANGIVFARKPAGAVGLPAARARCPDGLAPLAWAQLRPACERIAAAANRRAAG